MDHLDGSFRSSMGLDILLLLAQELQLHIFVVISLHLEQLVMRSLFGDLAILDEVTAQIGPGQSWQKHV